MVYRKDVAAVNGPSRSPLLLAKDTVLLTQGGITRQAACRVYQTLKSGSSIYVEFAGEKKEDFLDEGTVDVHLRKNQLKFRGFASRIAVTLDLQKNLRHLKQQVFPSSEPILVGRCKNLTVVEFALVNGASFFLEQTLNGRAIGHLILESVDWSVDIRQPTKAHRSLEAAIESNGVRLTQSGTLKRAKDAEFSSVQAGDLLAVLSLFLSFTAGWWVGMVFTHGRTSKGRLVWQQWGIGRVQSPANHSWFHWKMDGMLAKLFPNFVELFQHATSREALQSVLYWYNRSNSLAAGVDGSIILTQAAFELLAWHVLVHDTKLLSEDNFHSLNAEGQMRVLLGQLGIPLTIPGGLTELSRMAKELNWSCAPQALVAVRNQLVHPSRKRGKSHATRIEYPYYESWLLGQQLLELSLLRLCRYDGTFMDRTDLRMFREPKMVPWNPAPARPWPREPES